MKPMILTKVRASAGWKMKSKDLFEISHRHSTHSSLDCTHSSLALSTKITKKISYNSCKLVDVFTSKRAMVKMACAVLLYLGSWEKSRPSLTTKSNNKLSRR
jgi:hypothetical protein